MAGGSTRDRRTAAGGGERAPPSPIGQGLRRLARGVILGAVSAAVSSHDVPSPRQRAHDRAWMSYAGMWLLCFGLYAEGFAAFGAAAGQAMRAALAIVVPWAAWASSCCGRRGPCRGRRKTAGRACS